MSKKKQRITIKLISITVLFIIAIFVSIGMLNFLKGSDYFKIKDIVYFGINNPSEIDKYMSSLRGENLLKINLNQIEENILQRYPYFGKVKIQRVFPNRLRIDIVIRKPIAIIKSENIYLFIDNEGKVIQKTKLLEGTGSPIVIGLNPDFKNDKLEPSKKLSLVLMLLKTIKEFKNLEAYRISKIDASDIKNLSFFINNDIQIKIGDDDFRNRLNVLSMLIEKVKTEIKDIQYIDLRFKEPAIAKR